MSTLKVLTEENSPISADKLADCVFSVLNQTDNLYLELKFVSEQEIKELNFQYRNVDKITDVLSFPMLEGIRGQVVKKEFFPLDYDEEENAVFLGSIVICVERAKEQAKEYGHSLERELNYLACHGMLHLFGYDHMEDEDKKQMRSLEEEIMNKLGITRE